MTSRDIETTTFQRILEAVLLLITGSNTKLLTAVLGCSYRVGNLNFYKSRTKIHKISPFLQL